MWSIGRDDSGIVLTWFPNLLLVGVWKMAWNMCLPAMNQCPSSGKGGCWVRNSCFIWAVGVWSGGLLFSCTEGEKPLKHSHPRREFDQLLLPGLPRPLSAQEEARCNRSFCWTWSFVIETCTSWNWNFILFLNFYLFFKLKNGVFFGCAGSAFPCINFL